MTNTTAKKTYLNESMLPLSEEEKRYNRASYRRVLTIYAGDMLLCNDIPNIDMSIWDNVNFPFYDEEEGETDIYQWYLCSLTDYQRQALQDRGILLSYSELLGLDVIAVDHWGTSWDYVLTDSELTNDLNEI